MICEFNLLEILYGCEKDGNAVCRVICL